MPRGRIRTLVAALAMGLATGLLAGCGGGSAETATGATSGPTGSPPELTAEVLQSRQDQVAEVVRVSLTNASGAEVDVRRVELVAQPFAPAPVDRGARSDLAPGRTVDVRVPHGDPDCGSADRVSSPHVELDLGPDGARLEVPVPPEVLDGLLARLCGEERLAELVDVGFGSTWRREGDDLVGTLQLRRTPGAADRPELVLVDTAPTVILGLTPLQGAAPVVATLAPEQEEVTVPVRVGSPRCDPHALLESKKTYVFAAWVAADGGEPIWRAVEAQGEARAVMGALLAEVCDLG